MNDTKVQLHSLSDTVIITLARMGGGYSSLFVCVCVLPQNWCLSSKSKEATTLNMVIIYKTWLSKRQKSSFW